jgi:small multidrug resistance family-3 protein
MQNILIFFTAAIFEIAGCFAVWSWWRLDKSVLWLAPAGLCLGLFAWLLTTVDVEHAGRAYAIYGGVYIVASMAWLWVVEGTRPDRWDSVGSMICLIGAAIILYAPREM